LEVSQVIGQRIGYKRVSTLYQNTATQLDGVPVGQVFEDKVSGKNVARPQLQAALEFCREGDTLVVHSMDRLARNLGDLLSLVKGLTDCGVAVQFIKESLTFTGDDGPISQLLLSFLGAMAQFERALILERQREGIAIAQAAGKYKGRKRTLSTAQVKDLRTRAASGGESKAALARELGISRETLYQYLKVKAGDARNTA
jgi:DNA invertase Pin-like site-specific DNA recombinase